MKSIVVAYDTDRTIGREGELPWAGQLPADMRHFKELTNGKSVIMGRKTFESLPEAFRPLPNRQNIILSLSAKAIAGADVVNSFDEALKVAQHDALVIGGAQVYQQAISIVDTIYATEIDTKSVNGDAFFPQLDMAQWDVADTQTFEANEKNKFNHSFVTFIRRNPIVVSDSKD